jgi:CheY-like chemotaxis protein
LEDTILEEPNSADSSTTSKPLNILIAEDESDIAVLYKTVLEKRKHKTTITTNGEDCLKAYHEVCQRKRLATEQQLHPQYGHAFLSKDLPFDVVILDCKIKGFGQIMTESVQKPFEIKRLIDLVEDKIIYQELSKLNVDIDIIKALNPTHEQLSDLIQRLRDVRYLNSDQHE